MSYGLWTSVKNFVFTEMKLAQNKKKEFDFFRCVSGDGLRTFPRPFFLHGLEMKRQVTDR